MLEELFWKNKNIPEEIKDEILLLYNLGVEVYELEYLISVRLNEIENKKILSSV